MKRYAVKLAILENTPDACLHFIFSCSRCTPLQKPCPFLNFHCLAQDLQLDRLRLLLEDVYNIWQLWNDLEDVGHSGAARPRTYVIFARKDARVLRQPTDLYKQVTDHLKGLLSTEPKDYLTASPLEVDLEAAEVCRIRKVAHRPGRADLSYILTDREKRAISILSQEYVRRFKELPESNSNLCFFLGDDPQWSYTWSAISNKIPTLRRNAASSKMWFPSVRRWLTQAETLGAMSIPVRWAVANEMGLQPVPVKDPKRAASLVGNAMAFSCVGVIQMISLSCFSFPE
ncbi:unnamed protein product [Symbiodinium pilosum]|uniref:Uncharacterized protein n=1 Tax=Symbiodinium pilosum TaxID=2952 RepID=A0A812UNU8_SYMPI|nr:unnamed protein product [Symbiodinium pilosum]